VVPVTVVPVTVVPVTVVYVTVAHGAAATRRTSGSAARAVAVSPPCARRLKFPALLHILRNGRRDERQLCVARGTPRTNWFTAGCGEALLGWGS